MARLSKQVLGRVSGKVGDVQFRQRNGKNIVGINPDSFIPGNDEASKERRSRFATTVKFSKAVYSLSELKGFWKQDTPEGLSAFNYVFRKNYNYAQPDSITPKALLVPEYGFAVSTVSVTIASTEIALELNAIGHDNNIDNLVELNCLLSMVIYLSNPTDVNLDPYAFIHFSSASTPLDLDTNLIFSITPDSSIQQLISSYQDTFGYFSLITLGNNNEAVHYSSTFTS